MTTDDRRSPDGTLTDPDATLTDDERARQPARDEDALPVEDGTRSDHAGTGAGLAGPAPRGGTTDDAGGAIPHDAPDRPETPDGGSEDTAAPGPQTAWLRDAPGRSDGS